MSADVNPITKVCKECGSEDVQHDAWAIWDLENQCWELGPCFDDAFCRDCDGPCDVVDKIKEVTV